MPQAPTPPYIPAKYHGGHQDVIHRIVMHGTVSACTRGGARAIARYFQNPGSEVSAHYVVDPGEAVQCVYDHTIAWHDGTNTDSIGVELCDPVDADPDRWKGADHQAMLREAATLVRQLCDAYGVPKERISAAQIRAGHKGICGHSDMRDAFPGSTSHHDPGAGFPWDELMKLVRDGSGGGGGGPVVPGDDVTLKLGDDGPMVEWLQGQLNSDLKTKPGIKVTGSFDNDTREAVARFQKEQDLGFAGTRWLGIAGPKTIAKLKETKD